MQFDSVAAIVQYLEPIVNENPPQTVVFLDVHGTLLSLDRAMHSVFRKRYAAPFKTLLEDMTVEEVDELFVFSTTIGDLRLVDAGFSKVIQQWQKKKVGVFALSGCLTGKVGPIERMEVWLYHALLRVGVDFSSPSFDSYFSLEGFPLYRDSLPMHYHGILLANRVSKGDVLKAFFTRSGFHPKKVILVDNDEKKIKDVEDKLKVFTDISFTGILCSNETISLEMNEEEFLSWWKQRIEECKHG